MKRDGTSLGWMYASFCGDCKYLLPLSEYDGPLKTCRACVLKGRMKRQKKLVEQKPERPGGLQWICKEEALRLKSWSGCQPGWCHVDGCSGDLVTRDDLVGKLCASHSQVCHLNAVNVGFCIVWENRFEFKL